MKLHKTVQPLKKGVARVPVIMQMEARECGAISLAMVLAYYKNGSRRSRRRPIATSGGTAPVFGALCGQRRTMD